jgi:hypothetical protein
MAIQHFAVVVSKGDLKMSEIRIDAGKAERMITQILCDDHGMRADDAGALAASICQRLAMAVSRCPSLGQCRIIPKDPPDADDFAIAVAKKLNEGKGERWKASELWQLVYNQGRHLRVC